MTDTPALITDLVAAINAGDTPAFLGFFPEDGAVIDWGRRFTGHTAIRKWSDKELIGARGTMTLIELVSANPTEILVDMDWKSNFFSGASRFRFVLRSGKLFEMHISES